MKVLYRSTVTTFSADYTCLGELGERDDFVGLDSSIYRYKFVLVINMICQQCIYCIA